MILIGVLDVGSLGYLPPRKWDTKKKRVGETDDGI
jgi:hypothetical protein